MAWVPSRSCRSEPTPPQPISTNLATRPFALNEELYEEWLRTERANLHERAIEALMSLLRCHLDAGNAEHGVRVARRVLALDPLRETAHRALMRLHADMGDRALALRQYQACCDLLN
ncbi:MAG: bacterial transcriptional activator domain-containing protein, partial [Burkholderiales bacterium]